MKKQLLLLVSLLLPLVASAAAVEIDGIYYNLVSEGQQAEVTSKPSGYFYSGSITIPESVKNKGITYSVTSIGESAFQGCKGLTSVTIGNSVTSIGESAFRNCSGLTSIEIPNSVTSIGKSAFNNCYGLTSVTIPNSVTSIGGFAFSSCTGLTSITCLAPNPPSCKGLYVFNGVKSACILMVPEPSIDLYKAAYQWKDFSIIEATGIQDVKNGKIEGVKYYDLNGNQSSLPRKGLNIVRMSNGKTKKVLVK